MGLPTFHCRCGSVVPATAAWIDDRGGWETIVCGPGCIALTHDVTPLHVDAVLRETPLASASDMLAEVMRRSGGKADPVTARRLILDAKRGGA